MTYAEPMVKSSLKILGAVALAAAVVWVVSMVGSSLLVAGLVAVTVVALYWRLSSSSSRTASELRPDPAVSTLVFPPESRLH